MEFLKEVIFAIAGGSGFAALDWKTVVMLVIACVLLYMGIGKGFEPLLLVPIAFGMLLATARPLRAVNTIELSSIPTSCGSIIS